MEQLPAISIDAPDPSGRTLYVSPQIRDLLGISPADHIGRSDVWETLIHPDDRQRMIDEYLSRLRPGNRSRVTTATSVRTGHGVDP